MRDLTTEGENRVSRPRDLFEELAMYEDEWGPYLTGMRELVEKHGFKERADSLGRKVTTWNPLEKGATTMTHEMKTAHARAPTEPGWYSVCMVADPDFHDQFPFCPPMVVFYDGTSDDILYDPLTPCGGGIQGIESVSWWGSLVPDKPFPYLEPVDDPNRG